MLRIGLALSLFCPLFLAAPVGQTSTFALTIRAQKFKNDKGVVFLLLENERQEKVATRSVKLQNKQISVVFEDLPAGKYAVSFFHDANENGKLDTGIFGIPREGWGCSNDARGFMSAPSFKDKLVDLHTHKSIDLSVVNY